MRTNLGEEDLKVVSALRETGLEVLSVWDVVHMRRSYPEAIPTLVRMLPEVRDLGVKEGIVRSLSVKDAISVAAKPLVHEYQLLLGSSDLAASNLRWAIANALTVVATKDSIDDLIDLLGRPEGGSGRQMLALALGKLKAQKAVPLLIELLEDDEVVGHAVSALGTLKAQEARPYLVKLVTHPRTWVRNEAKKAILKIDGKPMTRRAQMRIN